MMMMMQQTLRRRLTVAHVWCILLVVLAASSATVGLLLHDDDDDDDFDDLPRRRANNGHRPLPTPAQQAYADHEIMALIHFNMGTYLGDGDPACNRDNWGGRFSGSGNPALFHPYLLDTDQWAGVFQRLGAHHAVLTAKHGCGFLLWPSDVLIHSNTTDEPLIPYNYAVGRPGISAISYDVLDRFVTSMRQANLGVGFYYSLKNNFYLNRKNHHFQVNASDLLPGQIQMTHDAYETMALGHLRELWSRYGPLTEQWFDFGYTPSIRDRLKALLEELQPDMIVWSEDAKNLTDSAIAWVGTESGSPDGDDIWSTGCEGGNPGHPDSPDWCPKGCDTTLQDHDRWFYDPDGTIRSLETLVRLYHKTVGRNGVLELDVAVDNTGRIRYDHAQRYGQLGDYIRACYGTPLRRWHDRQGYVIDFDVQGPIGIDRVLLREDQWRGGQRVRQYKVYVQLEKQQSLRKDDKKKWTFFSEGRSIGNKRIDILGSNNATQPMIVTSLRIHVIAATDVPMFREIAVFSPCPDPNSFVSTATEVL